MKLICLFLLCALLFLGGCSNPHVPVSEHTTESVALPADVRAVWISQFDLSPMCMASGIPRPREDFESRAVLMVSKLKMIGVNTVFIQTRPNADALYPSALFPPSSYIVGINGIHPEYDPFDILVEACKQAELSVHAWINPLRAMRIDDPRAQNTAYPVGAWIAANKPYVSAVGDCYYLNPAYAEVRTLVVAGAQEILKTYDVDGIHIDDYFYPTTDPSFDAAAYQEYQTNGGAHALADFRRAQSETLVRALSEATRAEGRLFGISPGGNVRRNVEELYADVEAWCMQGLLDYLCPQVYFGMEHETQPFAEVCRTFDAWTSAANIPLIVGMTLEKAANASVGGEDPYAGTGKREWIDNRDVLARCLQATGELPSCRGVALFSYRLLFSPENGADNTSTVEECEALLPVFKEMTW